MVARVTLDAMIRRADFATQSEASSIELIEKLNIEHISGQGGLLKLLRKPDFQRETNHWSPEQVATLINSFAQGELIPSLILWKSSSLVFVIDGAHRLSALRAWVDNDYGDGSISFGFYGGKITNEQKRRAIYTRTLVEKMVGRFSDFKAMSVDDLSADAAKAKVVSNIFTRSLHIQWIQGSQEVAESSFFKINSRGTALDPIEELLLKNRKKSYAIAARSVVRSGTGHKYWSQFTEKTQSEIELAAATVNQLLFQPDVNEPIKTLDLPLGGTTSSVEALKMLIDIFAVVEGEGDPSKAINNLEEDVDGSRSVDILSKTKKVARRMTGNDAGSLGLHPAVYFYTENGKHSRFLFLGVLKVIADAVRSNSSQWFKLFSERRGDIEKILVSRKSLINQALANINSRQRIDRVANLIRDLVDLPKTGQKADDKAILQSLGLRGKAGELKLIDAPEGFSDATKSAAYLQDALKSAVRCKECGGYLDASKAISYDHINPKREGGKGTLENAQLLHPYCNTAMKG